VPASGVNFWLVPLRLQVGLMLSSMRSCCVIACSYVLQPLTMLYRMTGSVHVDLRHALDWLPVVRVQHLMRKDVVDLTQPCLAGGASCAAQAMPSVYC
jgi:hypothetical protein